MDELKEYIAENPEVGGILFIVVFCCFFIFVISLLGKMGWQKFSNKYASLYEGSFEKIGLISAHIGSVKYNNAVILKANDKGLYFKGFLIFKVAHPPFCIPFDDILRLEHKKMFGARVTTLIVKDRDLPSIKLQTKVWEKVADRFDVEIK